MNYLIIMIHYEIRRINFYLQTVGIFKIAINVFRYKRYKHINLSVYHKIVMKVPRQRWTIHKKVLYIEYKHYR